MRHIPSAEVRGIQDAQPGARELAKVVWRLGIYVSSVLHTLTRELACVVPCTSVA